MKHSFFISLLLFSVSFPVLLQAQAIIPFAKGIADKKEIKLSEVASAIKYIPLETTAESLLEQDILDVTIAGGYLFVCDYKKLFQFTLEGKFVRQIGRAGQGPGEYTESILGVTYNEPLKEIYLSDPRQLKLHVYSFDGKFLHDINMEGREYVRLQNDGCFYAIYNDFLYDKQKRGKEMVVYDGDGKELYNFRFRPKEGVRYPGINFTLPVIYTYQNAIYYKNPLEQEINRIEKKKRKPVYKLDLHDLEKLNHEEDGKLVIDREKQVGGYQPNEIAKKKIYFQDIFELDHNMGIYYIQEDEGRFAWYDKQNGKVCRVRSLQADKDGFTDDLEGGSPVLPNFLRNGKLVGVVPAPVLQEKVDPENVRGSLKRVMEELLEEDNQVIQIVTLK